MLKLSTKRCARNALLAGFLGTAGLALALSPAAAQMRGSGGGFHGGGFHGGGFHSSAASHSAAPRGFDRDRFGRFDRDDRFGHFGTGFRGGWWHGRWYGPGWWGWGVYGYPAWWGGYYPYYDGYPYCSQYDYYYGYCGY